MNCIISIGVANAAWLAGETQSTHAATPRAAAISSVTLGPGSTPPWPGLAPWLSFNSIIFTCGCRAFSAKRVSLKDPSSLRQPKQPEPISQIRSPPPPWPSGPRW